MSESEDPLKIIRETILRLEVENSTTSIVILGAAEEGLDERSRIRDRVMDEHPETAVLIPEDQY